MATALLPVMDDWKTPIGTIVSGSGAPRYTARWMTNGSSILLSVLATLVRPTGVLSQRYKQRMPGSTREG